jgi:MFS family permease
MIGSSLGLACIALPAFSLLQNPTLATVIAVRILIIVGGVAFASVYHAWALELAPPQHRFTILSLGSALGAQCIGAPACAISLWLFQTTHLPIAPALYLIAISSLAGGVLYLQYAKKLKESYSEKRTAI